ncbi:MAG TPA: glutaredoxin family protein [Gammaproteobacteria bacterium]|nr:glutaredoxin family protein [Gammaproteobacteria bacterium]
MRTLRLYSRPGCHLCEEMADALAPLLAGRAAIEPVDISGDEGLERRYGLRIPVLADGDREVSGYPLDKAAVERWLSEP